MLDLETAYENLRQRARAIGVELPRFRPRPEDLCAYRRTITAVEERHLDRLRRQVQLRPERAKPIKRKRRKTTVTYDFQHNGHVKDYKAVRAQRHLQQAQAHAYDHSAEDLADDFFPGELQGDYFPHLDPMLSSPYCGGAEFHLNWRRSLLSRFQHLGY